MATITTRFSLVDNVSSPMGRITRSVQNSTKGFESMAGKLVVVNSALDLLGKGIEAIKDIGSFFGEFVSDASDYENILSNLTVTLGDAGRAQREFNELEKVASETPFNLPDIAKASVMLRNVGVESEKIIPTIKMLGDASRGNKEAFNSIIMNYAQIQSIGKASMMDMKQFAGQMLPVFDLMKDMGIEGQATAEQVEEMFRRMTSEGGKFYKGMEIASKTLSGKISTLQDDFKSLTSSLGNALLPSVKDVTTAFDDLFKLIKNSTVFRELKLKLNKMAWEIKHNLDTIIATMINVGTVATTVGAVMATAWAVAHWPLTLIIIAITTIIRLIYDMTATANENSKEMTGSFNQITQSLSRFGAVLGGIGAMFGGIFDLVYNLVATVWNAILMISEHIMNIPNWFLHPIQSVKNMFLDLASTVLELLSSIAGAFDFFAGTSMSAKLNEWDEKIQKLKREQTPDLYHYDRAELKNIDSIKSGAISGAEWGKRFGEMADAMLTFNGSYYKPSVWAGDQTPEKYRQYMLDHPNSDLPLDSNGNLKVAVQNDLRINDEYKQRLAELSVERYKKEYSTMAPTINFGGINISETVDANKVIDMVANGLAELASSDLRA